jgi:hypothetical protein
LEWATLIAHKCVMLMVRQQLLVRARMVCCGDNSFSAGCLLSGLVLQSVVGSPVISRFVVARFS